ncbi:MAG: DUF1175 domain-containing protein [Acidobacteriia bacterium]|nr:DUF1175 domain-containing protein [Terriglobia bacterium]
MARKSRRLVHVLVLCALLLGATAAGLFSANFSEPSSADSSTHPNSAAVNPAVGPVPSPDGPRGFLLLDSPEDREAFRQWFTLLAEYQALRPPAELPSEINDCAALIRFSYRNALHAHDPGWFREMRLTPPRALPSVEKYSYPHTPLGAALFRIHPGLPENAGGFPQLFAEFADAKTLRSLNTFFVSRDIRDARPGDLLFYFQKEQETPFHSMIFIGKSPWAAQTAAPPDDSFVVYHTGPIEKHAGEMRRLTLTELLRHPSPRWRPLRGNPNFLGIYRWNILREAY